ncbi:hypothetical protein [Piscinibacter sakaiensis]|uniref:hypothetical protein n=1 Tax=Piscinibacter sakaiensis TaxID=1547922 RepID=UPI003AAE0B14
MIVLWVLAGLTVVAVAVASSAQLSASSVKLLRDRVQAEAGFLSASARIAVIAATGLPTANFIDGPAGRLYVDGRLTDTGGGTTATLQDLRGLVNLNRSASETIAKLLVQCGASEQAAATLTDTLADYIDEDRLRRLNGAEAFDYRASGDLPEPRNAPLLSREELWRIKGWPELKSAWQAAGCDEHITVNGDSRLNRNTATVPVLVANGFEKAIAEGLVAARQAGADDAVPVAVRAGIPTSAAEFGIQIGGASAGKALRIRQHAPLLEWQSEFELELTPGRPGGPWRMLEVRVLPHSPSAEQRRALAQLPAVDFRQAEQDRPSYAQPSLPFGK